MAESEQFICAMCLQLGIAAVGLSVSHDKDGSQELLGGTVQEMLNSLNGGLTDSAYVNEGMFVG